MFRVITRACALALAGASLAHADLQGTLIATDSFGITGGGEFVAELTNLGFVSPAIGPGPAGSFETFCMEHNEAVTFGATNYYCLNTGTVAGGAGGGVGGFDPLDPRTAYLYEKFITGSLAGYTYSLVGGDAARAASADALQHVLWFLEEEEAQAWTPGDNSLMDMFYNDAVANAGPTIGNVRILNVFADAAGTVNVQDMIVMTPEPGSAALCLLGAGLLAWRRRS